MHQKKKPAFLGSRPVSLAVGAAVVLGVCAPACYDDSGFDLDRDRGDPSSQSRSGSSTSGGKSPTTSGGKAAGGAGAGGANQAGSDGGAGGDGLGGAAEVDASYPEPTIDSMDPPSGAYGTTVTIHGAGLGNPRLAGFVLALGKQGEVELSPRDKQSVVSWTDEEIVFRFPFPAEGTVALESPKGAVVVGEFEPTWHIAQEIELAPAATVLASISPEPGRIEMLFDTTPLTLLDVGPDGVVEHAVIAPGVDPNSLRLYLSAGVVHAIGVSSGADPVLVPLLNQADDLVAKPTTIKLGATEFAVAGGSGGAAVWMRQADGWHRARPTGATWKLDKGPIAEPNANAPDRASGATSDGSLYVAHSVDTGNFLDDMEAAYMARLTPTGTKFSADAVAGSSVDDYVSELTLRSHGDGLVVRTCGSDVDPFALSGTDHYCYDALHAPSGAHLFGVPVDVKSTLHAFTNQRAVATYCSGDGTWLIRTDTDVEETPGMPIGEPVLFPCPEGLALEISGAADYVPVIRWADKTYLLERNPAVK